MTSKSELIRDLESFGKIVHTSFSDPDEPLAYQREREIELMKRQLIGSRRSSLLIVGPSGVGKTAMIHELARRLAFRSSESWIMLETSTSGLMAGTRYLGDWQARFFAMLQVATRKNRVILYITDLPNLINAGRHSEGDENMAESISPFIERNEVVLLGECHEEGFRVGIDRHPWFKKQFNIVQVLPQKENDIAIVIKELIASRGRESLKNSGLCLDWQPEAIAAVQQFGSLYFPGLSPPGGAAQLVDQLITAKKTEAEVSPRRQSELPVNRDDVINALHSSTSLPVHMVDDSHALKLNEVRQFMEARVIGQDEALAAVIDLITLIKAGLTDPTKPLGILLFIGPTGVGKTELAKALTEFIFGSSSRMIRLDMSEYMENNSFEKIIGTHLADRELGKSSSLLARVRGQPFSVILLDEIEKAHPNIFDLLLQLFDDGRLTDAMGRTTNFTQTIIIMTSNLGGEINEGMAMGFRPESDSESNYINQAVKDFFRPELINRIDRIVRFMPLKREHVRILAQRELGNVLLRSGITRRQLRVDVDRGVIEVLADAGFDREYGARPLKRAVERLALLPIARQLAESNADNRPALLRLVPLGKRIELKIIYDRQSRKNETLLKGITLQDTTTEKNKKISRKQILAEKDQVLHLIVELEEECEQRQLRNQRTHLVEWTAKPNFWDEPTHAREILGELYRTERIIESVDRLKSRKDDLVQQLETAMNGTDERRLTAAFRRIRELGQHTQLVQYSLRCCNHYDRCDAFVAITSIDQHPDDIVGHLTDMYINWSKRKGLSSTIVHEELISPKITREVVLLIEGVAIYGLLSAEDGLHEFIYGRTSKAARETHFVKVRIMAIVDNDTAELGALTSKKQTCKGIGLRTPRYRSQVQVTHVASGTSVKLRSGLTIDKAEELAKELLAADLRRTTHVPKPLNQPDEVVRRYTMRPNQSAKDIRTGHVTHNLRELWNGDIDDFLAAAIAKHDA